MTEKILIVDDEENVLNGIKRSLRKIKGIHTAIGAAQGLKTIDAEGPFAVVISDQQMPDIDGITFLKEVRERNPAAIRMMLTGNADQKTAVDAVKDAGIFRFPDEDKSGTAIPLHARLIKILKDLAEHTDERRPTSVAFDRLAQNAELYDPRLLEIVRKCLSMKEDQAAQEKLLELNAMALEPGDIVAKDIYSTSGTLILSENHELSDAAIQKIKLYVKLKKLEEPLGVLRQIEA